MGVVAAGTNGGGGVDLGGGDGFRIFPKIRCKPICQVACHFIVCGGGGPGIPRVEEFCRDAGAAGRHGHAEDGMGVILHFIEGAIEGGGDHGAGIGQLDAAALAVGAAGPAGVDHPDLDPVLFDLPAQQLGIAARVQGKKGSAEAGAEGRFGLGDPGFGPRYFCGIAGDELVHGLAGVEPGDRGQHAIGVAGEKEDIGGNGAHGGFQGVADVREGIGYAGIFGNGAIVEVDTVGAGIEFDILHQGAGTNGMVDLRFLVFAEVDTFGIAAPFEIEDIVFGPSVFVVADEPAAGVGAECRFAGAAEAEEDGGVAFGTFVGGAMHAQYIPVAGEEEVQDREDRFLDLAGVGGAGHYDQAVAEGDDYGGGATGPAFGGIEGESGSGQDLPVRMEIFQLFFARPEEHVVGKEVSAGGLVDDPDVEAVARVGADAAVAHEKSGRFVEPGSHGGKDAMKMGRVDGLVEVVPMDRAGGDLVFDDVAVFGGPARESACADHECTGIAPHCFFTVKAMQGEFVRWQLVVDGIGDTQPETAKTVRRESNDRRRHKRQSFVWGKAKIIFFISRPEKAG